MWASTSRGFNVARQIRAGHVTVSGVGGPPAPASPGDGQGPGWGADMKGIGQSGAFGGYKQSGLGREWGHHRSEEHTSELPSLMRISYAVLCLQKKNTDTPAN